MKATKKERYFYIALIFLIGLISAYDNLCTWIFREQIIANEKNPIGVMLICLDNGQVGIFMTAKALSTILCVIICLGLVHTKYRVAIIGVAVFQVGLFIYLNHADSSHKSHSHTDVYEAVLDEVSR